MIIETFLSLFPLIELSNIMIRELGSLTFIWIKLVGNYLELKLLNLKFKIVYLSSFHFTFGRDGVPYSLLTEGRQRNALFLCIITITFENVVLSHVDKAQTLLEAFSFQMCRLQRSTGNRPFLWLLLQKGKDISHSLKLLTNT